MLEILNEKAPDDQNVDKNLDTILKFDTAPYKVKTTTRISQADPRTKTPMMGSEAVVWEKLGVPHKETGPAIIPPDADESSPTWEGGEYYLFGKRYDSFRDWYRAVEYVQNLRQEKGMRSPSPPPAMPDQFRSTPVKMPEPTKPSLSDLMKSDETEPGVKPAPSPQDVKGTIATPLRRKK